MFIPKKKIMFFVLLLFLLIMQAELTCICEKIERKAKQVYVKYPNYNKCVEIFPQSFLLVCVFFFSYLIS